MAVKCPTAKRTSSTILHREGSKGGHVHPGDDFEIDRMLSVTVCEGVDEEPAFSRKLQRLATVAFNRYV